MIRDDDRREQVRVLERLVEELREAVTPGTTPVRRARIIRNVEIVYWYVNDGWSTQELAAQFQLSAIYIANILRWYHIPLSMRRHGLTVRNARFAQELADGATIRQLAERHDLSPKKVRQLLLQQGIQPPAEACPDPADGEGGRPVDALPPGEIINVSKTTASTTNPDSAWS